MENLYRVKAELRQFSQMPTFYTLLVGYYPSLRCALEIVDLPRPIVPLIRPSQTISAYDLSQQFLTVSVRSKCVPIGLWSESSALGKISDRKTSNAGLSNILRSNRLWLDLVPLELYMMRPSCAWGRLWSNSNAIEIVWSENDFMNKPHNFAIIFSFQENWCLL